MEQPPTAEAPVVDAATQALVDSMQSTEALAPAEPIEPAPEPIKVMAKDVHKQAITFTVAPHLLTPNRANIRYKKPTEARLRHLAESLAENGQIQPLGVEKLPGSALGIVHGNNRWAAAMYGIEHGILPDYWEIRYELVDIADDAARRKKNITENVEREDLSPIELAMAFDAYVKDGYSQRDAAALLGKKSAWGNAAKYLLQLPEKYKDMVHDGRMSAELGFEIMAAPEGQAEKVLKTIRAKGLPLNRPSFRAELREISDAELPPNNEAEALAPDNVTEPPETRIQATKKVATGRKKQGNKSTKRSTTDQRKFWQPYAEGGEKYTPTMMAVGKVMLEFAMGKCSDKRMAAFVATLKISKPKE